MITRTVAPTVTTNIDKIKTLLETQQASFDARIVTLQQLQDDFIKKQEQKEEKWMKGLLS
jgi:hypothetical protein